MVKCVHFGFAVNVAGGIGLALAEILWLVSGMSIWMLVSGIGKCPEIINPDLDMNEQLSFLKSILVLVD